MHALQQVGLGTQQICCLQWCRCVSAHCLGISSQEKQAMEAMPSETHIGLTHIGLRAPHFLDAVATDTYLLMS